MKIAFVYDVPYPWHKGGVEQILAREAEALAQEHEVHFFTLRWPTMGERFVRNGVHYHTFGHATEENVYRHGRRSIREAVAFAFYSLAIFRGGFDAVVTDEFPVLHLLFIRLYRLITRCRLIIRVDEVWDREYWLGYLGRIPGTLAYRLADALMFSRSAFYITNSGLTSKKLVARGVRHEQMGILAPVLEGSLINDAVASVKNTYPRVIFAGRFIKEKRIDKWLSVFSKVSKRERRAEGLLVGEGVERRQIGEVIAELRLGKKVKVKEFYKNKLELYRAIAGSSVFLQMSEREGLSIITLESLALGTPVVVPDYSPIPDDVKRMCVVVPESSIPAKVCEILRSKDKSRYVRNTEALSAFSTEGVRAFYKKIL